MAVKRAILVAEDNPTDVFILKRAFLKAGIDPHMFFVRDGQEAVDYLEGENDFSDRKAHPFPELMLLDLKMPKLDGFDVLKWVRKQPGLGRLLIIVLTSSNQAKDVNRAYDLGANSYLVKPSRLDDFIEVVEKLHGYWMGINEGPTAKPGEGTDGK
jgi:CheY-like chemotaxis protein